MQSSSLNVPEGYTVLENNGQKFLVPDFAVRHLKMKLDAEVKRKDLGADNNTNKVGRQLSPLIYLNYFSLGIILNWVVV